MDKQTKRRLLRACKIDEPVPPGDPRHHDFDERPGLLRGQPWRERAAEVIDLSDEPVTQIVTGLPGSGKTTELRQLEADLRQRGYRVIFADAGEWIRDDQPMTTQDMLLALILTLYPSARPDSLSGWVREYVQQVWSFFDSEARLTEVDSSISLANLKAELTTKDTLFQQAARHLGAVRGLRDKAFELLATAAAGASKEGGRLVLIIDGIEKRATGALAGPEERERFRSHWFGAFLVNARDLRPPIDVIYTVPPFMIRRAAELGNQFGNELLFLPMVRVLSWSRSDADRPSVHVPGLLAMRTALYRRIGERFFDDPVIPAWLTLHSGGYMRDLLRLVIECIYRCPPGEKITRELAEAAIVQVRQTYLEGIEKNDELLLRQVHDERDFPRSPENQSRMDSLLQGYLMLRYHNQRFWYDAHPLLWPRLGVKGPTWDEIAAACS